MARRAAGAGGTLPVAEGHRCCPEGKAQSEGHGPVPLTAFLLLGGRRLVSRVSWCPDLQKTIKDVLLRFALFLWPPIDNQLKESIVLGP